MENVSHCHDNTQIIVTKLGNIGSQQDGAIYGDHLFHFDETGCCRVYVLPKLTHAATFRLPDAERILPHSNAVSFGCQFYDPADAFPLVYCNVYNNYQNEADRREGMCCVYRILRQGGDFSAQLVQLLRVGFTDDPALWRSPNIPDVRPYGNFVIDRQQNALYAFVMRDETRSTRFFRFRLPSAEAGTFSPQYGVPLLELTPADICASFDTEYFHYIQGAACADGLLCSSEGFEASSGVMPVLRVVDTALGKTILTVDLASLGMTREAELVELYQGRLLYADCTGDLFELSFGDSRSLFELSRSGS